ncbi:serine/threonine protein kinase, partial [Pyxidicoccus sp. 3LG]
MPVKAGDVTTDGFFAAWEGPLPPLASRLSGQVSFGGRTLTCACDVVRHVTRDEARIWNVHAGVFVQFDGAEESLISFVLKSALATDAYGVRT